MQDRIHVAVVYGSVRDGRLCDRVGGWVLSRLDARADVTVSVLDPREHRANGYAALKGQLERADAFIVVTPEYNHGYPAALKELLDAAYTEWQGKVAGFVSYGARSGGIRAVEQLRQVFAELHVATVRDGVAFVDAWDRFDAYGALTEAARAERAFGTMLTQLTWWARALREGRRAAPYAELAS
jgi:NAD(P)H-dependent FMN reductase